MMTVRLHRPFNSRPHKEVDVIGIYLRLCHTLSIHDLTRRSTVDEKELNEYLNLSIHDLTRRSTGTSLNQRRIFSLSIHDLTRRSTEPSSPPSPPSATFNSRPHKEVDKKKMAARAAEETFNSRPHKEVDAARSVATAVTDPFNSRPHKEVDTFICAV